MEIWQSVVLGFLQGLTEFLPVSSSGHLAFAQYLMGVSGDSALFFSLILHLGTLVAVCAVFFKDIIALFKKPFKTLLYLVVATIPAVVVGLLFSIFDVDDYFYSSRYIGILLSLFFMLTAAFLFVTEMLAKNRQKSLPLSLKTTVPMGVAQALAVIPGISRSGSTICAGALSGLDRKEVAKFSFLMSIPVILGGFVLELGKGLIDGKIQADFAANGSIYGICVAIGFVVSAVAGLFAIKVMLKAIEKMNLKWFSLYLLLLAIVCIILNCTDYLGSI